MMSSKEKSSTGSDNDVWIPQRHGSGEVLATVLQVTLPIHKLVLLSLQYMYRIKKRDNSGSIGNTALAVCSGPLMNKPEWLFWSALLLSAGE